jgi:hypothetical protein
VIRLRVIRRDLSLRSMLPQLYVSWEEGYEVVVELYWLGTFNPWADESRVTLQARFDLPPRLGEWLLPRYNRWSEEKTWVS